MSARRVARVAADAEASPTVEPSGDALHACLLDAHARDDREALADLYRRAADDAERTDDTDAACFFLTQAWVFALQAGLDSADDLRRRLARHGRA